MSAVVARLSTVAAIGVSTMVLLGCGGNASSTSPTSPSPVAPLGPAPAVTAVAPRTGFSSGGTAITISGSGFTPGATLTLGGIAAVNVAVVSGTSITATTPPHAEGTVEVVVRNPDGQTGRLAGGYSFLAQPTTINGDWVGTTAELDAVMFTVQNNGLSSFRLINNSANTSSCPGFSTAFSPPAPITNNQFSNSDLVLFSVSGRFASTISASGSLTLSLGSCRLNTTWSARRP